jgi:hypothetical protein
MDGQELKKKISYYTITGNNLKTFLGEQQLKDLKGVLDQLKGTISEKEWTQLIGRSYNCFITEIDFKLAEYQHGTSPNQQKPVITPPPSPTPSTEPIKPAQPDQSTQPSQESKPTETKPTDTTTTPSKPSTDTGLPTPDPSRPSTPDIEKPTPEQLETAKYDKLLKELKAEIDPEKLKDGNYYAQEIDKLDYNLLTLEKQPQYLHDERTTRRSNLLDKEKEAKWTA